MTPVDRLARADSGGSKVERDTGRYFTWNADQTDPANGANPSPPSPFP